MRIRFGHVVDVKKICFYVLYNRNNFIYYYYYYACSTDRMEKKIYKIEREKKEIYVPDAESRGSDNVRLWSDESSSVVKLTLSRFYCYIFKLYIIARRTCIVIL